MKDLPWFRFHTDFLTNDRIQLLSFDDRAHYVGILCLKGRGSIDKFADDPELQLMAIAKSLGLDPLTADEVRFRLVKVGLIGEDWEPVGWDERQYLTDNPDYNAEKQKRYRQRNRKSLNGKGKTKSVTTALPRVTVPDTETDTDTEKKTRGAKRAPRDFALTIQMYEWAERELGFPADRVQSFTAEFMDHEFKNAKKDWPAVWRNWLRRSARYGNEKTQRGSDYTSNLERLRREAGLAES